MFLPTFPLLMPIYMACLLTPKGRSFWVGALNRLPPPLTRPASRTQEMSWGEGMGFFGSSWVLWRPVFSLSFRLSLGGISLLIESDEEERQK